MIGLLDTQMLEGKYDQMHGSIYCSLKEKELCIPSPD